MSQYQNVHYLNSERIAAYLEQFKNVAPGEKVLEIGKGAGVAGDLIRKIAGEYKTLDIDESLCPDIAADITSFESMKQFQNYFDAIHCCQVLEHIPYDQSLKAIENFFKLAPKKVVLSLPDNRRPLKFKFQIPKLKWHKVFSVPGTGKDVNIENHKQHYWEINSKNYQKIKSDMRCNENYHLSKEFRLFERPYQHFFIFERQK